MHIYKAILISPLELLVGKEGAVLWDIRGLTRDIVGVNIPDATPRRRAFYFDKHLYWVDPEKEVLYRQKRNDHILSDAFDHVPYEQQYIYDGPMFRVLQEFQSAGYRIQDDSTEKVRSR